MRDPLGRLFPGLPRSVRVVLDWLLTVAGAVLIVFALNSELNPCRSVVLDGADAPLRPRRSAASRAGDRVLERFIYRFRDPKRGRSSSSASESRCGATL